MSTPRYMQAGVPQGSVLSPTLYNLYINYTPQTIGVNLALFANDTCLYATESREGYILRKVQCFLNSMSTWCERWHIKINEDKNQAVYFSHRKGPLASLLSLNWRNIPFVNNVKYLGVIFDERITWRLHISSKPRPSEHSLDYIPYSKMNDCPLTLNWPSTKHWLDLQWLMLVPPWNLRQKLIYWSCSACKIRFSAICTSTRYMGIISINSVRCST
jgi:hypothetical protein